MENVSENPELSHHIRLLPVTATANRTAHRVAATVATALLKVLSWAYVMMCSAPL